MLGLVWLAACKDEQPAAPESQTTNAQTVAPSDDVGIHSPEPEAAEPEPEPTPPELILDPQLRVFFETVAKLDQRLKTPVGTLSGEMYKTQELVGVTRASCGEGVLIQPIFRAKSGLQIGIPVRLELGELVTAKPVRYRDGEFNVEAHFTHDSPERIAGTLHITHQASGVERSLITLDVDAPPVLGQLQPTLQGQKNLPFYEQCAPTGYFRAQAGSKMFTGYVNVRDVGKKAAPRITIPVTPYDRLEFFFIPPKPNHEFKEAVQFNLKEGPQQEAPALLMAKVVQMRPVVEPLDAIGRNLSAVREATLLEGLAKTTLVKKGKRWRVSMQLENLRMPDGIKGPLENATFERIDIEAILGDGSTNPLLDDAPDWWNGDRND